jgi:hypothetical protein
MWETTFTNPMNEPVRKATLRLAAEGGHIACVDYTLATGVYENSADRACHSGKRSYRVCPVFAESQRYP